MLVTTPGGTNATNTLYSYVTPSVSIAVSPARVSEDGATNLTYTLARSHNITSPTVVNITTSGTTTSGTDYTGAVATVTIPAGATITIDPTIDGNVEAGETVVLTVDAGTGCTVGAPAGASGTIINEDVTVTVSPATLLAGAVAAAYSQTITASGGVLRYGFVLRAGALPTGLTLLRGGVLSGTPNAGGTFNFTVTATDSSGAPGPFAGSRAFTVAIAAPMIVLSATSLAGGTLGTPYSATISPASGGTAPYAYAVTAGALPGGLTLDAATGAITGTLSALGSFNFSITATDSSTGTGPFTASQAYSIAIGTGTQAALTATATPASITFNGTSLIAVTGGSGSGALTYAVTAGGTTVAGEGQINGESACPEGVRGRAEIGVPAGILDCVSVDLSGSYDGIGSDGYHATTGRAMLQVPLS